jgi:hypothetical protein
MTTANHSHKAWTDKGGHVTYTYMPNMEEWHLLHKEELLGDWALAQNRQPLIRIDPLE